MTGQNDAGCHVEIGGDNSALFTIGDNNTVVQHQPVVALDTTRLAEFARAVGEALPALGLHDEQRGLAGDIAGRILREADEPGADHGRLRALGQSLRATLEGALAGALSGALLALWTP